MIVEFMPFELRFNGELVSVTDLLERMPDQAVITGITGSGKSRLLQLIYEEPSPPDKPPRVPIFYQDPSRAA